MFRIAILLSGTGSNFVSVVDAINDSTIPNSEIACVISDNPQAKGLVTAKNMGLKAYSIDKKRINSNLSDHILSILSENEPTDLIVLAGFLSILEGRLIQLYKNKIVNIHPSLIPSFSGKGMWGINVHKAVIDYGAKFSGCTTHIVDSGTDTGAIILQAVVPVNTQDPSELQQSIIKEEHKLLVKTIAHFAKGEITINGRKVEITER